MKNFKVKNLLLALRDSLGAQLEALRKADLDNVIERNKTNNELLSDLSFMLSQTVVKEFAAENKDLLVEVRKLLKINNTLLGNLIKISDSFHKSLLAHLVEKRRNCSGVFLSELG